MVAKNGLWAVVATLFVAGLAHADGYTPWVPGVAKKTYNCEYTYKNTAGEPCKQYVAIYYDDKQRNQWAYFYNADKKPWARCAIPGNPSYTPKKMYWEELQPKMDSYAPFQNPKTMTPYTADSGYCPAPKDAPMSPIPPLPALPPDLPLPPP